MKFSEIVYIRIKPTWLSVRSIDSGKEYQDIPQLAINNEERVVGIGRDAEAAYLTDKTLIQLLNGFEHPRVIIGNYQIAEKTLELFLKKIASPNSWLQRKILIMHPLEKLEGGLTRIEACAFQDIGKRLGAHKVYVWAGRDLHEGEMKNESFSVDEAGHGGELIFI
jgi:rod shape-determining protein MreB and related proteins